MSGKRILIIEDNPVNMELATDLLDTAGYVTLQADNAEEGIRLARAANPDLVLMDIQLPGMDGLTATKILKSDPQTRHLRIVALTAHAMKGDEERALALGCIGYITKPINTRSFSRLVGEFCDMAVEEMPVAISDTPTVAETAVPAIISDGPAVPAVVETPVSPTISDAPSKETPVFAEPLAIFDTPIPAEALAILEEPLGPVAVEPAPAITGPAPAPVLADPAPTVVPPTAPASLNRDAFVNKSIDLEPISLEPIAIEPIPLTPVTLEATPLPLTPVTLEATPLPLTPVTLEATPLAPVPDLPAPVMREQPPVVLDTPVPVFAPPAPPVSTVVPAETEPALSLARRNRRGRQREFIAPVLEVQSARILVVDDDELNREMITAQLRTLGYEAELAHDGFQALEMIDDTYDLVLCDFMMPGLDGCEVVRNVRDQKRLMDLPIIMVTALSGREDQLRAVEAGANDWITKPVDRTELSVRVRNQLRFKEAQNALKRHRRELEATVRARTADLRKALEQVTAEQERTKEAYLDTMNRLALAAEFRDGFMAAAHIRCVGNYCATIARAMRLPDPVAETLLHASTIHDIGMLSVPEYIIRKGEQRTPEEEAIFREHTVLGARLLSGARSELLRAGEVIALSHHERWDGSGYPQGLQGENIPLFGRICAVADTFDTITAYNGGEWQASNEEAREVLMAGRGHDFDPQVIDAFLSCWDEILTLQRRFRRTEAPPADMMIRTLAQAA